MDADLPTADLARRLQAGDPRAAAELFDRFAGRLIRLAEQHLSRRVAVREGGEDLVQSVFRTFFRRSARGEFQAGSAADLWRLLVKITVLKARAKGRHHTAGLRDVRAEVAADDGWLVNTLNREPGPDEAAILLDQIESLLDGLPELHGQILGLRMQGHTPAEIAVQLGYSRRTIERSLALLRQRLSRLSPD